MRSLPHRSLINRRVSSGGCHQHQHQYDQDKQKYDLFHRILLIRLARLRSGLLSSGLITVRCLSALWQRRLAPATAVFSANPCPCGPPVRRIYLPRFLQRQPVSLPTFAVPNGECRARARRAVAPGCLLSTAIRVFQAFAGKLS